MSELPSQKPIKKTTPHIEILTNDNNPPLKE